MDIKIESHLWVPFFDLPVINHVFYILKLIDYHSINIHDFQSPYGIIYHILNTDGNLLYRVWKRYWISPWNYILEDPYVSYIYDSKFPLHVLSSFLSGWGNGYIYPYTCSFLLNPSIFLLRFSRNIKPLKHPLIHLFLPYLFTLPIHSFHGKLTVFRPSPLFYFFPHRLTMVLTIKPLQAIPFYTLLTHDRRIPGIKKESSLNTIITKPLPTTFQPASYLLWIRCVTVVHAVLTPLVYAVLITGTPDTYQTIFLILFCILHIAYGAVIIDFCPSLYGHVLYGAW